MTGQLQELYFWFEFGFQTSWWPSHNSRGSSFKIHCTTEVISTTLVLLIVQNFLLAWTVALKTAQWLERLVTFPKVVSFTERESLALLSRRINHKVLSFREVGPGHQILVVLKHTFAYCVEHIIRAIEQVSGNMERFELRNGSSKATIAGPRRGDPWGLAGWATVA